MNYCSCPDCRGYCPNAESYATEAEHENDTFVIGDIIRLRKVLSSLAICDSHLVAHQLAPRNDCPICALAAQKEEIEKLRAALEEINKAARKSMDDKKGSSAIWASWLFDKTCVALTKPQPPQT